MELGVRCAFLRARGRGNHECWALAVRDWGAERTLATNSGVVWVGGDGGFEERGRCWWLSGGSSVTTGAKRGRSTGAPVGRRDGDGMELASNWFSVNLGFNSNPFALKLG